MEMQAQSVSWWRMALGAMISRLSGNRNRSDDGVKSVTNIFEGTLASGTGATGFWSDFARKAVPLDERGGIPRVDGNAKVAILVPVDFSGSSFQALDCGLRLARKAKGELILLHVVHLNLTPYGPGNPDWLKTALRREAADRIQAVADRALEAGVTARCVIEEGALAETIARIATENEAQIVVMAAPKRGPIARLFHRKTVEHVIRDVQCPVLVLQTNVREGIL